MAGLLVTATLAISSPADAAAPTGGNSGGGNPIGDILDDVGKVVDKVTHPATGSGGGGGGTAGGGARSAGTGSAGRTDSADRAGGSVVSVGTRKRPVADVAKSRATAKKKRASADATLLALGGVSVIGSQADSDGQTTASGPVPRIPLCDASGGALCLDLLYADSAASRNAQGTDASTRTGVADACVGGHDSTGATCDGVHLGVAQNDSSVHRGATGSGSRSTSSGANACVAGTAGCTVGVDVLGSTSSSGKGATAQKPTLAQVLLGDVDFGRVAGPDDPARVEVTKDCATPILCLILNRAENDGTASSSNGAGDASALDGNVLGGVSDTYSASSGGSPASAPTPVVGHGKQGGSASGAVGDVGLGGLPILGLSQNRSQGDLDRTTGDATLLSLFGQEILGSHADSSGATQADDGVPQNLLCDFSGGALCLDLLYANSAATRSADRSDASTATGVADLCLGGDDATGATCNGLEAGVAQGSSFVHNDGRSGVTESGATTSLADLCLHGDTACTVSADALKSSGYADSKGGKDSSSSIADVAVDGQAVGAPGDPIDVSVPADCPSPSLACVFLNQVAAAAQDGSTTGGATVIGVTGLGGTAQGTVSQTEVTATGGGTTVEPPTVNPPTVDPPANPPAGPSLDRPGVLPNTGGVQSQILGIGLLLVALGAGGMLWSRRRRLV